MDTGIAILLALGLVGAAVVLARRQVDDDGPESESVCSAAGGSQQQQAACGYLVTKAQQAGSFAATGLTSSAPSAWSWVQGLKA